MQNTSISVKKWLLIALPVATFFAGGLVYAITIGTIYGKAITRLDNVEKVAVGNSQKNEQLEEVMRSEIRSVRRYMFALNTNIAVIGAQLGIRKDKLSIPEIDQDLAHKDRINE